MREDVGAVRELVYRTDKTNGLYDAAQLFIADGCRQGIRESFRVNDAIRAVVVASRCWVEGIRKRERVLHSRYRLIGVREMSFAFLPA